MCKQVIVFDDEINQAIRATIYTVFVTRNKPAKEYTRHQNGQSPLTVAAAHLRDDKTNRFT